MRAQGLTVEPLASRFKRRINANSMDTIDSIRKFVENECRKPSSQYGFEPYEYHFKPMVGYALALCDELGGDKEVIELAVWLHDIGSIMFGRADHHLTGARIAEKKLRELNYPAGKIELVKKCILSHRGSQKIKGQTIEEKIVADADAMSSFDNLGGLFKAAFIYERKDQKEAMRTVREKLENKWNQLSFPASQKIVQPKYEAMKVLLALI